MMSCGNSEQELERAGVNALAICRAPYINADGIMWLPFQQTSQRSKINVNLGAHL
jgi:hypothetical protein